LSKPTEASSTLHVALAGNPNSGKTSIFNALTGLRRKVGNYPGVTVERIEAELALPDGTRSKIVDLPGSYSLYAVSEDERIARDVLLGLVKGSPRPDVVVAVVDATNLERNLYFATQLMETGLRVCIALNMVDLAERRGTPVDAAILEEAVGVPVVPVIGRTGLNVEALREAVLRAERAPRRWRMVEAGEQALNAVREAVAFAGIVPDEAEEGEALRLLSNAREHDPFLAKGGSALRHAVASAREKLEADGIDRVALEAECRYALCNDVARRVRKERSAKASAVSERIDKVLTHRVLGPVVYLLIMGLIFQAVYSWATPFMDAIEAGTGWLGGFLADLLGPGMLTDLVVDGVIAGVGNILVFLPQICLLFFFLTLLEDVGYLSRAAFLVDRIMRGVGLNGKAFIPLMSSFACAIPGIMATRTIESRRDRLVTILVAPLMSCSARLPVYALMIGAFIPAGYQGLTLLGMYALSVVAALAVAWILRRTLFRGAASTFILELPPYRLPAAKHVARTVADRGLVFVRQAGTIILAISVVLWFLAYFPRSEEVAAEAQARIEAGEEPAAVENWERAAQRQQSFAGTLGRAIEPVITPLGFDWKVGIGLVASFAAREVLVSTLGIVYSVGEADETSFALRDKLRHAKRPDGTPAFTWLTALSLMVFFVLACQCMSTLAVVKRETNSWRWPIFMFGYMTVLAYGASLVVYQGGLALGLP
jgi:ferrous iron transport protein B